MRKEDMRENSKRGCLQIFSVSFANSNKYVLKNKKAGKRACFNNRRVEETLEKGNPVVGGKVSSEKPQGSVLDSSWN